MTRITAVNQPAAKPKNRASLAPVRHANDDFFLTSYKILKSHKDDLATMDAPMFSLKTQPDLEPWKWTSSDGKRSLSVRGGSLGRATIFDKDVLIFALSQITQGINERNSDALSRKIRFTAHDYLRSTNRTTGGRDYRNLIASLDRLSSTTVKTTIITGPRGKRVTEAFPLITYKLIEDEGVANQDTRIVPIEITLCEWLHDAVQNHQVLTINRDYFRLRKALERRLYEIARKHCGLKEQWPLSVETLLSKSGAKTSIKEFRRMIRDIIDAQTLLDYRITMIDDTVTFIRLSDAVGVDTGQGGQAGQRNLPLGDK